ncbi:3-keto-5-aminohexanoate cleavage protein [Verticiella sediminum]|nr:3-keto-5-aminohexanoate cleavage protein [Verticiella sediminum]
MAKQKKVIVTCAVTGAIHTPTMSPHLPVTAEQIREAAVGAVQAGAAIVHLHAREPETGRPSQDVELFRAFVSDIKAECDGVINLTTGGSPAMTVQERLQPALRLAPEVASLNMGSMNFGLHPMLGKYKDFKHDWEPAYLEATRDMVFRNTFKDIEYILESCQDNGTRFELECYDTSHLYNLAHFVDRGLIEGPLFIQTVFGILGGIGTHPDDVSHMRRTADRLFGTDYVWSVLGAGRFQMPIGSMAAAMGGNVRVGLEDSLWDGPGTLAESNAAQVRRIRGILEGLSLAIATPDEAREMLGLKGKQNVGF